LAITNVTFDYPDVDVGSASINIDNSNSGLFVKLPKINRHVAHIDFDYTIFYLFHFTWGVDFKFKDFQVDSGLSVKSEPVTGNVTMQPYSTEIDFGRSNIKFTDNIILESIWFFVDLLRTPVIWVIDWYI
jgi:hypothetical protein